MITSMIVGSIILALTFLASWLLWPDFEREFDADMRRRLAELDADERRRRQL